MWRFFFPVTDEIPAPGSDRDLLGDPVNAAHDNWGAPAFEKNKENQDLVTILRAAGWTQERIARRVGCDPKTLRKHFSRELAEAADIVEAAALQKIMGRMGDGNVSAANKLLSLIEKGHAAVPVAPDPEDDQPDPGDDAEKPLGKKAALAVAARKPGAKWGGLLN
jgi:lambda repressor-like predicted transcriptional regulator